MAGETTTTTPTPTGDVWHKGADAEIVGYLQTKGWHDKPASEVALAAVKSYKEAEKHIGAPPDRILRMPKDASDADGYNTLYARLGVPKEATGYDFKDIKFQSGEELDANFVTHMQAKALAAHLTPQAAREMTQAVVQFMEQSEQADIADRTAALNAEKTNLANNWGANKDANMVVARNAARALGVTDAEVTALESVVGYARIMEMFRQIGTKTGEDKFVQSGNPGLNNGIMTREQAQSRKSELMADTVWRDAYLKGDTAKRREMLAINQIITGSME